MRRITETNSLGFSTIYKYYVDGILHIGVDQDPILWMFQLIAMLPRNALALLHSEVVMVTDFWFTRVITWIMQWLYAPGEWEQAITGSKAMATEMTCAETCHLV